MKRNILLTLAVVLCGASLALPAAAQEVEYLQGIHEKAQDHFRAGLESALRKLPKCAQTQLLENGECCAPGFVSLGKECARVAPPVCAAVAIDAPDECKITRCAKYVRTIEKEVEVPGEDGKPAVGDDGKPKLEKKSEEVPCEPWPNGVRDLTCELDTYDCKKEEIASGPARWCGDWIKQVPAPAEVDAAGKPIVKPDTFVRCKAGSEGCVLDVRECTGAELTSNKSDGAGPCKIGEYVDYASGKCTAYKCPAHCTTPDGRCSKCGPDYVGATQLFTKATEADKRFYEAYFNLGMAHERLGRYKEAVAAYEAAKTIEPKDEREKSLQLSAQAYIARARMAEARRFEEAGEIEKAKAEREAAKSVCESIIGQDPDNAMANVGLGLYYLENDDLERAEHFVRQALRANREDTIALNVRGLINLKHGKNEIARWILEEKVLALDPANPEALANLGLAYVRLGDLPKAVAAFERAVKLNPNSISARLNLGAIYLEYLNYSGAVKQYNAALKLEPENLEALTGYALSLEGKREPKQAAGIYERVLAKDPSRKAIMVRLAILYDKAPFNDGDKALVYWKRFQKESGLPAAEAVKLERDGVRGELAKMTRPPKKGKPEWLAQKETLEKKDKELTELYKNSVAIQSRIDAIEQAKQLQQQANQPEPKTP